MKIVLDAMGGDFGPAPNVEAAVNTAREFGWEIVLVGRQELIRPLLVQHNTANLHLPIVHASEVIEMGVFFRRRDMGAKSNSGRVC